MFPIVADLLFVSCHNNNVQLFTEYGKLAMNQDDDVKAFQVFFVFV